MLCYVVLWFAMLCYVMLCYVMLRMYLCICVFVYLCIYVFMYVCMYVCMYLHWVHRGGHPQFSSLWLQIPTIVGPYSSLVAELRAPQVLIWTGDFAIRRLIVTGNSSSSEIRGF